MSRAEVTHKTPPETASGHKEIDAAAAAFSSDQTPKETLKRKQPGASPRDSESSSPPPRSRPRQAQSASSHSPSLNYDDDEEQPPLPDEQPPLPDEQPPLPDEHPPLPHEPLPRASTLPQASPPDDGWEAIWELTAGAYYYFNRFTQVTQWDNPRVPDTVTAAASNIERAPGTSAAPSHIGYVNKAGGEDIHPAVANGYNPAIHGDYDPNADYAQFGKEEEDTSGAVDPGMSGGAAPGTNYEAVGQFNRFTGRFQHHTLTPDNFNDDAKSRRQLSAFYNVDDAANSHNGKSLKAERSGKKLSAKEVKEFKERRRARKEEKRRAWLRD